MEELRQSFMFPGIRPQYTAQQCLERLMALPPLKRAIVERVWECAFMHYRLTHRQLKLTDLESLLKRRYKDQPNSQSSYSRVHKAYPELVWWPILYGQRPPWEGAILPEEAPVERKLDDDVAEPAEQIAAGQLTFDQGRPLLDGKPVLLEVARNGIIHVRYIVQAVAAMLAATVMLDGMDGKYDGIVHWCRVLDGILPTLTR